MRVLKALVIGLLVLVLVPLAGGLATDPVFTSRLVQLPFGGGSGPQALVPGGDVPEIRVAAPGLRTISDAALDAALDYGAETKSHALLIYQNGMLQLEHYYPGANAQTITPTQSMHKSVLAMLVGIAIDQGHIGSVNDPVGRYIAEWANDDRGTITLRQMLQQSSGIDFPGFFGFMRLTLGDQLEDRTLAQAVLSVPGERFEYNGINPEVLGIVIQRATGQPYAAYLAENFWRYVSADDAHVVLDSDATRTPLTFCCLNATARSWLRIGKLHLDQGRVGERQVVPADWLAAITTPASTNSNYGYLTWLGNEFVAERRYNSKSSAAATHSAPFVAPDVIYFDGFGGQRVYIVPSRDLVIVRTGPMTFEWDDARLPNAIIAGLRSPGATGD